MARKLPDTSAIVQKTVQRAQNAPQAWLDGLTRARGTIVSGAKAADQKWKTAMQDAIARDAFGKGLANVTDDDVIAAATKVGGNAWLNGLTSRQDKLMKAWQVLGPKLQALMDKVHALPNVTPVDGENRMLENLRGMRKLRKSAS